MPQSYFEGFKAEMVLTTSLHWEEQHHQPHFLLTAERKACWRGSWREITQGSNWPGAHTAGRRELFLSVLGEQCCGLMKQTPGESTAHRLVGAKAGNVPEAGMRVCSDRDLDSGVRGTSIGWHFMEDKF